MILTLTILIAVIFDFLVGEPRRWHPLVGFGNAAYWLESKLNQSPCKRPFLAQLSGLFAWTLLIIPIVIIVWLIGNIGVLIQFDLMIEILFLTFAIGAKSLIEHAKNVVKALRRSDISLAREKVAMIVSRDTTNSDENAINRATIETVLENGSDAIFAAIFWFIILGAPGVILYRLANTLDAMWGYRTERFNSFGWAAARIDDGLNWLPARLTAVSYALAGNLCSSLTCWLKQARHWYGINPGVVMASGAGALRVKLGGSAIYHGTIVKRPELGCNNEPQVKDIDRAIKLIYKSIVIWLLIIAVGEFFIVRI